MKARISHTKDALVIEFPKRNLSDHQGFILKDKDPYFMEIMNIGWIDPKEHEHKEVIGNYGEFQDFIPSVELLILLDNPEISSTLLDKPEIGCSFYGLVGFLKLATPSDYLKGREIHGNSSKFLSLLSTALGKGATLNKRYYHSFPIVKVGEFDIYNKLEQICKDTNIHPKNKLKEIKRLLN
ncbi:MAG: hypothetical protein IIA85_02235 [Nanoarchaeota archaeon]|nr:hypothetical protein [Nanoarchaeota archaeon]